MWYGIDGHTNWQPKNTDYFTAVSKENNSLFQIFSSEIDFRREDVLSQLKTQNGTLNPVFSVIPSTGNGTYGYNKYNSILESQTPVPTHKSFAPTDGEIEDGIMQNRPNFIKYSSVGKPTADIFRWRISQKPDSKVSEKFVFPLYNSAYNTSYSQGNIKSIKDVKIPQWSDGFSNLQLGADDGGIVEGGIKKYKEFTTSIDNFTFDNWISFGLYDVRISRHDSQQNNNANCGALYLAGDTPRTKEELIDSISSNLSWGATRGWIGPGPSCFVMTVDENLGKQLGTTQDTTCATIICNIEHDVTTGDSEPDEFVQYFGFGNFFRLQKDGNEYKVVHNRTGANGKEITDTNMVVFDGDIYITPQEITTMYKTYDFMSYDTLQSM
jgi:hypothetical protein